MIIAAKTGLIATLETLGRKIKETFYIFFIGKKKPISKTSSNLHN